MESVSQLIISEREKRGWSQRQLAAYAEISNTAVGTIERGEVRPTAITLNKIANALNINVHPLLVAAGYLEAVDYHPGAATTSVPIYGEIRAGMPLLAIQDEDGVIEVSTALTTTGTYFALRIKGDSMIDDGILPGSIVLVRRTPEVDDGAIAVVLVDREEATVKRIHYKNGHVVLESANSRYRDQTYATGEVLILGEVVEIRTMPKRR